MNVGFAALKTEEQLTITKGRNFLFFFATVYRQKIEKNKIKKKTDQV